MKRLSKISGIILLIVLLIPVASWAIPIGGPHLWLSTDPGSYFGINSDPWINETSVTSSNPFDLSIYHAASNAVAATDIQLLLTIHNGESGSITVDGISYSSFTGIALPTEYNAGSHGVYDPSGDGRYAIAGLGFDLDPLETRLVEIGWAGFSEIHIDVFSSNGFYNPPSHDASAVPEPGTLLLLGSGLLGAGIFRKRFRK